MYFCEKCGCEFERPEVIRDNPCEIPGYFELWEVCPHCGSEEFLTESICSACGLGYPEANKESSLKLCPACRSEVLKRFQKFIAENFTCEEVLYLDECYDGRDLSEKITREKLSKERSGVKYPIQKKLIL